MKTNLYFYLLLVSLFSLPVNAAGSGYQDEMRTALASLDAAAPSQYLSCRNQFERVAQLYPDEWLPVYYTVYCDLQMIYTKQAVENAQALLEETKNLLDKLEATPGADPSELSTLWGYYYMALIMLDAANGQKYFTQVIGGYEKAIALNPENPRPVCLLAFFKQFMPAFMRSESEIAEGKEKAKALFEKETPSIEKPYWGAYYLGMIKQ
jgi:tetratricopeptide (TPR) repeat protein